MTSDPAPQLTRLQEWYRSPLGGDVAKVECACVQRLLANTFGYYLVQVGVIDSHREALVASRIRHRIQLPVSGADGLEGAGIVGLPTQLPLASDSIDAILLPHTLDYSDQPKQVLSEVERVLIPEGRVILMGFNALSAWGLRSLFWDFGKRMPWCGRFRLVSQVEDWLAALGFDIDACEHVLFCPPFGTRLGPRCASYDALGRRLWPMFGGIYVIRAIKRVATLTPIKPLRPSRHRLLPGRAVRPTTRGGEHV